MTRTQELTSARWPKRCPVGLWLTKGRTDENATPPAPPHEGRTWSPALDVREVSEVVHVDETTGRPWVVAEILSDGTVQVLDRAGEVRSGTPWSSGTIAGPSWTIWWERRRWGDG